MATRGTKVERASVSDQPHELAYEAHKTSISKDEVKKAKSTAGNQRKAIEKEVK